MTIIIDKIKKNPGLFVLGTVFVLAEVCLSVAIQLTEYETYERLAYSSVILACVFSFLTLFFGEGRWLLRLGLCFTVLADYFLIVSEPIEELTGVVIFSGAQICYFLALFLTEDRRLRLVHICARVGAVALVLPIAAALLGSRADPLTMWSLFYYVNLALSVVFAFLDSGRFALFGVGLVLFAMCDATLGLGFFATEYLHVGKDNPLYYLANSSVNIPWVFYVPSQTLISLSTVGR